LRAERQSGAGASELSPRALAVRFTDEKRYFVPEASVYRLLKAHDLNTGPAYVVIKAAAPQVNCKLTYAYGRLFPHRSCDELNSGLFESLLYRVGRLLIARSLALRFAQTDTRSPSIFIDEFDPCGFESPPDLIQSGSAWGARSILQLMNSNGKGTGPFQGVQLGEFPNRSNTVATKIGTLEPQNG
jgi:hypothetical protein